MEKKSRFLLIVVFIILLIIVALNFDKISGKVVGSIDNVQISVNPDTVSFTRFDSSHVVNVFVETRGIPLDPIYFLESESGHIVSQAMLCPGNVCTDVISDNFIIDSSIDSGSYHFIFHCSRCGENQKIASSSFVVTHV